MKGRCVLRKLSGDTVVRLGTTSGVGQSCLGVAEQSGGSGTKGGNVPVAG